MKIEKLLKRYRASKDLSQKDLAKKLGYGSSQFISNIERGTSIGISLAKRFSKKLGISREEFRKLYIKAFDQAWAKK